MATGARLRSSSGQAQLYVIGGVAIVMLLMLAGIHYYKSKYEVTDARFDAFKSETKALGEAAKANKALQEAANARQITDAVTSRDDALKRLSQERARSNRVPLTPAAASGSDQICFGQKALSAAVERYRAGVLGLVTQGDECAIDARTLIQAWPSNTARP